MDKENRLSNNASNIENFDDGEITFHSEGEAIEDSDDGDVKIYTRRETTPRKSESGRGEANIPRHMAQNFGRNALKANSFTERMKAFGKKIKGIFEKITAVGEGKQTVGDYGVETLGKDELLKDPTETCDDTTFVDAENGIFAVFDGASGEAGASRASGMAAEGMRDFVASRVPKNSEDLGQILTALSGKISRDEKAGFTTAVVGRFGVRDGKRVLDYASAGDSRIYVVRRNGEVEQITEDEAIGGNRIWNGLGFKNFTMTKKGEVEVKKGDMVLFCSDGITGDTKKDEMSNEEIARIFRSKAKNKNRAKAITHALVRRAKKIDDRTAIVVDVK